MIRAFKRRRFSPIGIDFDDNVCRAAQFVTDSHGLRLSSATEFTLPRTVSGVESAVLVRNVLHRRGFEGDRVALVAPLRLLESDLLDLSDNRDGGTSQAIRTLLAKASRTTSEEIEVSYWPRKSEFSPLSAFAVGLRHADAVRFVSPFEEAGLDVVSVRCGAGALANLLRRLGPDSPGGSARAGGSSCTAVVRLGLHTHVVLLCSGATVLYQRTLDIGGLAAAIPNRHTGQPAPTTLTLTDDLRTHLTDLATETTATFDCVPRTFGRIAISSVLLSGALADDATVSGYLGELLPRCSPIDLTSIPTGEHVPSPQPDLDVAVGLALSEVKS